MVIIIFLDNAWWSYHIGVHKHLFSQRTELFLVNSQRFIWSKQSLSSSIYDTSSLDSHIRESELQHSVFNLIAA